MREVIIEKKTRRKGLGPPLIEKLENRYRLAGRW
jgi:hypothetical protein